MSWTVARRPDAGTTGRFAARAKVVERKKGGLVFELALGPDAQSQMLGASIARAGVKVEVGRGTDHGRIRLCLDETSPIRASGAMARGSVKICVAAWDLLGREPAPAGDCAFVSIGPDGAILDLPSWGQPGARRAELEKEFGLKKGGV